MLKHCPGCGYDLAGLDAGESLRCPECGQKVVEDAAVHRQQLKRQFRNAGILAGFAPVMSLPGCAAAGIGQLLISWILASLFSYRALVLDEQLRNRSSPSGVRLTGAILLGLAWTLIADLILLALLMLVGWLIGAR